jgi:3-oxoacyl-(acyl-carrier-protein) synthase
MAGLSPGDIDYVCGSANGGRQLDQLEFAALQGVFSQAGAMPKVTALKGALGEGLSSGGMRAAAMALALGQQRCAPVVGLHAPLGDLDFVRSQERGTVLHHGLMNGISSGGTFVAVIFKKMQ